VGSSGYVNATLWAKFLTDRIKNFTLYPEAGPTVKGFRKMAQGKLMVTYGNTVVAEQAYADTGPFTKTPLGKIKVQQALPLFPFTFFMTVHKSSDIYKMDDLVGRRVSLTTPAHGIFPPAMDVFKAIGLWDKIDHKSMALSDLAGAMTGGIVESCMMFVVSDCTTAGALREVEARTDMRALTFSEAQKKKIRALPGIGFRSAKNVFKELKQETIPGWAYYYGWYFSPKADPEVVYEIVKTTYEFRKELTKSGIAFTPFSEQANELLQAGFTATPHVPLHPGAEKFYKEKGIIK